MGRKLMMNNTTNSNLPIISVHNQATAYSNSINLITKDVATVKFNINNITNDFALEYASFCKITYDGTSKLNLIFSSWDGGYSVKGQINYIQGADYYVVTTRIANDYTNFKVYNGDVLLFNGSYLVQAQPSYVFTMYGCYINTLEIYDSNIKG